MICRRSNAHFNVEEKKNKYPVSPFLFIKLFCLCFTVVSVIGSVFLENRICTETYHDLLTQNMIFHCVLWIVSGRVRSVKKERAEQERCIVELLFLSNGILYYTTIDLFRLTEGLYLKV